MNGITETKQVALSAENKVLKNTFMLLGATLAFSSLIAYVAIQMQAPFMNPWMMLALYFANLFALAKLQDTQWALPLCFSLTGLLGYTLGPVVGFYLTIPGGADLVSTAMGLTALMFFGLSGYALTTKKDFSYMSAFIFTGILVAFVGGILAMIFSWPAVALAVSAAFVFLSSAVILIQLSDIIHGGEKNYVMATVTIYVSLYNIFTSLLHLLTAFGGDD